MEQINKPLFDIKDFPTRLQDEGFWKVIEDKNLPRVINFLLLNVIRSSRSVDMSSDQCRTTLASAETLQRFLDFVLCLPENIEGSNEKISDEDRLANIN